MRGLRLAILCAGLACAAASAGLLSAPAKAADGPEWQHALWVAGELRARPPAGPVVVLLGGSCAREAVVNDVSWAADVQRLGGDQVTVYDLGSRLQTFEEDVALVKALPHIPMLVYIGINAGRFAAPFTTPTDTTPPATNPSFVRHHYRSSDTWPPERKQERVRYWLDQRQKLFDERFAAHEAQLDRLIGTCLQRGYTPVVLALPRNIVAMGHALDESVDRYLATGRRLAEQHGVTFVDFVPDLQLSDDDFFDLDHLVDHGREVYQARLSYETVGLLSAPQPQPPSQVQPRTATPGGSGRALWPVAFGFVLFGFVLAALRRRAVVRRKRSWRRRRLRFRVDEAPGRDRVSHTAPRPGTVPRLRDPGRTGRPSPDRS